MTPVETAKISPIKTAAAAASMLAGQTAVTEEEGEATQRHLTHSYCCIDYPRFVDMLQVSDRGPLAQARSRNTVRITGTLCAQQ